MKGLGLLNNKESEKIPTEKVLQLLSKIKTDDLSTYDQMLYDTDVHLVPLFNQIENDFKDMVYDINTMVDGNFRWGEELVFNTWQFNISEVVRYYSKLPEKHMVDLLKIHSFTNIVEPFHIRILLESSQEIF